MIVSGRNVVLEAVNANRAKKIFIRHGASIHFDNLMIPFEVLGRRTFEEAFGEETQGVVCETDEFEYTSFKSALPNLALSKGIVFLDKIQDPHNFGAIIRAAHCFGIKDIVVPRHDQAKVTPAVYRASAGAVFYTDIMEVTNLGNAVDDIKEIGFKVVSADMTGSVPLEELDCGSSPIAVIIGSEGKGIRDSLLERSDFTVSIPMDAKIDSLNASMSSAIICYELFMRRKKI